MTTLLFVDHANGQLSDVTAKALTAAVALGEPVQALVAGQDVEQVAAATAQLAGVEKVLVADSGHYAHGLAEPLAALIVHLAPQFAAIVAAATAASKNVMPRVAALLDVMQVSEITKVISADTFE